MSYIDALFDRNGDKIHIVERINGERKFTEFPASYVFYYEDQKANTNQFTEHQ